MMRRHELSDAQYAILEPYLPPSGTVGHPWEERHRILNGIFWKLHTGAQWRDIPERYGPWSTIYDRYRVQEPSICIAISCSALTAAERQVAGAPPASCHHQKEEGADGDSFRQTARPQATELGHTLAA